MPEVQGLSPRMSENGSAVDDRQLYPAADRALVERGVLRFRAERVGTDLPGEIRVEEHEVGRRADSQTADRQVQDMRRVCGQKPNHIKQTEMAVVIELERQRQQCLEPDDAVSRRAERQA